MTEQKHEVHVSFVRRYSQSEHLCPVCSTKFLGPRLRVYCSTKCRKQAAWQRNGPEMNAKRRKDKGVAE